MKRFVSAAFILSSASAAFAVDADPSRAIQRLHEIKAEREEAWDRLMRESEESDFGESDFRALPPTASVKQSVLSDWAKFHAGETFKFRIEHNMPPLDGFNFDVTQAYCQLVHVTPNGLDFGSETIQQGWVAPQPPLTYGETGRIESSKKACVNAFVCGYEVVIREIKDHPDGRVTIGPFGVNGNKGPLYDCFLEVTDKLQ